MWRLTLFPFSFNKEGTRGRNNKALLYTHLTSYVLVHTYTRYLTTTKQEEHPSLTSYTTGISSHEQST